MINVLKNEIQAKECSLPAEIYFNLSDITVVEIKVFRRMIFLFQLWLIHPKSNQRNNVFCILQKRKSYKCLCITEPDAQEEVLSQNKNCFIYFDKLPKIQWKTHCQYLYLFE